MKSRALLLALPLVALPLLVLSCRDNGASLQIQQVCAPTDDCSFSGSCDAEYIGEVSVDPLANASVGVSLYLQVENQTADNADEALGRVNTHDAHVDEVTVEYDPGVIPRQVRGANFYVPAGGTSVVKVRVIPPGYGAALDVLQGLQVTARVRLGGYWEDGSRFETAEFPVAIRVCDGCTQTCTAGSCPPNAVGQEPVVCMDPVGAGT